MKIVTLIEDGLGRLHLLATCAPDLARREFSAETGDGHLLWCGLAPAGIGARSVVDDLKLRFGVNEDGSLRTTSQAAVAALADLVAPRPRRSRWRPRLRRLSRVLLLLSVRRKITR